MCIKLAHKRSEIANNNNTFKSIEAFTNDVKHTDPPKSVTIV